MLSFISNIEILRHLEQYSRGRRGAPAKGVGRETGARVRISLAPPRKKQNFDTQCIEVFLFFGDFD